MKVQATLIPERYRTRVPAFAHDEGAGNRHSAEAKAGTVALASYGSASHF
jgi:hypothetical protein